MAHDLAVINGKDAMFMVGQREDAWHKLGQRCDSAVNWEQAMGLAGLDWQVMKTQNYARNPQGHVIPVSSYSIFRDTDGAELASNVGEGFTVKQNRECFQFVDDLLQTMAERTTIALEHSATVQRFGVPCECPRPTSQLIRKTRARAT